MCRPKPHALLSSDRSSAAGLTLIELLVTLAILSILAAAALPYAELTVRRDRELELHRALREVRSAIDAFHDDWAAGRISRSNELASADGYPRKLQVLVDGADTGHAAGGKRRYLRRIPRDPFAESASVAPDAQWVLRGYQDEPDVAAWNGEDVYDIRSASDGQAIDGTLYRDW
jgi:general secretion pathway protein G